MLPCLQIKSENSRPNSSSTSEIVKISQWYDSFTMCTVLQNISDLIFCMNMGQCAQVGLVSETSSIILSCAAVIVHSVCTVLKT